MQRLIPAYPPANDSSISNTQCMPIGTAQLDITAFRPKLVAQQLTIMDVVSIGGLGVGLYQDEQLPSWSGRLSTWPCPPSSTDQPHDLDHLLKPKNFHTS